METLLEKIKDGITAKNGLTTGEIASNYFGIKTDSPANDKLVSGILGSESQLYCEDGKWYAKTWMNTEELEKIPQTLGVYGFYDKNKKVIFVGRAKNLREELATINVKNLHQTAVSYIVSPCNNEASAADIEKKLIEKHKPILNAGLI